LIRSVTGIEASSSSPREERDRASRAFMEAWNYDFRWNILVQDQYFGELRTKMGHAVYSEGGVDYSSEVSCPFSAPEDVLAFDPESAYPLPSKAELTTAFELHYAEACAFFPDAANMTGTYVTCMSGLISIFGWDMLLVAAGTDPRAFGALTDRYARWMMRFFEALAEADLPLVMVHDDIVWTSGAFIHPDWYREYIFPNYRKYFAPLIDSGKKIMYTSDGTYTEFIDDIAACGVHGFVMEPTTDMAAIAERYGRSHVFVGNADTRVLLSGSRAEIRAEVERCMRIGKSCPGFIMAVGNHIPANTPVENALYYNEVYEELSRR
jgi:hypothetical protein